MIVHHLGSKNAESTAPVGLVSVYFALDIALNAKLGKRIELFQIDKARRYLREMAWEQARYQQLLNFLTTTMNKSTKSTNKFKTDDLDAIAAAGDWLLQKRRIGAKAAESWHLQGKARRIARKMGLVAHKCCSKHIGNLGWFQVVDPKRGNMVVAGERYDMTPQDVINFCCRKQPHG